MSCLWRALDDRLSSLPRYWFYEVLVPCCQQCPWLAKGRIGIDRDSSCSALVHFYHAVDVGFCFFCAPPFLVRDFESFSSEVISSPSPVSGELCVSLTTVLSAFLFSAFALIFMQVVFNRPSFDFFCSFYLRSLPGHSHPSIPPTFSF